MRTIWGWIEEEVGKERERRDQAGRPLHFHPITQQATQYRTHIAQKSIGIKEALHLLYTNLSGMCSFGSPCFLGVGL